MKNVVLIGFMGTGKTSTGRILAQRLGRSFVDIDKKIAEEAKQSIAAIFQKEGEAFFRAMEKAMVERVAKGRALVIATGGGTVKDHENVKALKKNSLIICLSASLDAILFRTAYTGERPLLNNKDESERRQAIKKLLNERRALYNVADYFIDTSELSPLQAANDIIKYLKKHR